MTVLWWHWIVLGLLLVVGELATPGGFYIIFFGIAAIIVGFVAALGADRPDSWISSLPLHVLLFSTLAVALLLLFRARLLKWFQLEPAGAARRRARGRDGTVTETLTPGSIGKVELRGTSWSARNISSEHSHPGRACRVTGVDGLMLHVGPEGGRS